MTLTLCQWLHDLNIELFFASYQTTYFVHLTKLLLITQYNNVQPTYGSTCYQSYSGGCKKKRLLS